MSFVGAVDETAINFKAALELAAGKPILVVTATVITWRLKALVDAPAQVSDGVPGTAVCSGARSRGHVLRALPQVMCNLCILCNLSGGYDLGTSRFRCSICISLENHSSARITPTKRMHMMHRLHRFRVADPYIQIDVTTGPNLFQHDAR